MNKAKMREQLIAHEGLRLEAYRDHLGNWTIGVGRNMQANPVDRELGRHVPYPGGRITNNEATILLNNDIDRFARAVQQNLSFYPRLSEPRQHVLIDMAFNLGISGLLSFRKMLQAVRDGNYGRAADEMLNSDWANQVGRRARTLADMMRNNHSFDGIAGPVTTGGGGSTGGGTGGGGNSGGGGSTDPRDTDPGGGGPDPRDTDPGGGSWR